MISRKMVHPDLAGRCCMIIGDSGAMGGDLVVECAMSTSRESVRNG
jgi:hypothetical protein